MNQLEKLHRNFDTAMNAFVAIASETLQGDDLSKTLRVCDDMRDNFEAASSALDASFMEISYMRVLNMVDQHPPFPSKARYVFEFWMRNFTDVDHREYGSIDEKCREALYRAARCDNSHLAIMIEEIESAKRVKDFK